MTALSKRSISGALALALWVLAATASALGVGRLSVGVVNGRNVLNVVTEGQASPSLENLDKKVLIVIPGGLRAMKTLRLSNGLVSQIRFGKDGSDLRVVLDLRQAAKAELGAIDAKGFVVDLGPAGGTVSSRANAEESDEALAPALSGYTYSIVDLALGGDDEHSELLISANGPASYKSSVREKGRVLSLLFRNSSLAYSGDLGRLTDDAIESVNAKQLQAGGETQVRVDIQLAGALNYALKRDQNQVLVQLGRPERRVATPKRGDIEASVSINVQNADLVGVLKMLCEQAGFEYQFSKELLAKTPPENLVTAKVKDRPLREVADTLLVPVTGRYLQQGNTLFFGTESEVTEKKARLPVIQRTYVPRYLTVKQSKEVLVAHYKRDFEKALGTSIAAEDPRDKTRLLLVGTADDVSSVLGTLAKYDVPESGEQAAGTEAGGSSTKTQVFRLQYLDPSKNGELVQSSIRQLYPEGETAPSMYLDTSTRTLVVTTQLKYLRKIEKLLARLDRRPDQVNIEGRIVEVNQSVAEQLGINWTATQQQASPNLSGSFDSGVAGSFISQLSYATVQNGFDINARIQALVNDSQAEVVSAPNITVNDYEQATIETTENLVTFKVTQQITNGISTTTTESSTFEVPLSLIVTPRISKAENRVLMDIDFNLTTQTGAAPAAGVQPPTSVQTAKTKVNVNSGDTAVIGGLVRQSNNLNERKVPVLGDIPLLGMLFKFKSENKEKKEVIIFITPTIVED